MQLPYRFETLATQHYIGLRRTMSMADNRTTQLFRDFMPRRGEVAPLRQDEVLALQVYPPDYFARFDPTRTFEKWALVAVAPATAVPPGMERFELPGGPYAVFTYRGSSADPAPFQYIFSEWLPQSGHTLDDRPHFEVLGPKFKPNQPDSEEEIWIPVAADL
jgi:AraC family transcriptional regulator